MSDHIVGYLPPMLASLVFRTFSRLKEPGVWLGGNSFIVIRNLPRRRHFGVQQTAPRYREFKEAVRQNL